MVFPESYNPPALPNPATASHRPAWILLDQDAYIASRGNATTAAATSCDGRTIEVSFWVADPPAVSYLCVRCRDENRHRDRGEVASLIRSLRSKSEDADFEFEPSVVGAEGRFVLIRVRLSFTGGSDEYFMFRADPESPTLERVPLPSGYRLPLKDFGIVPRGDESHYLLAVHNMASFQAPFTYELYVYSSEDQTWSTKPLPDTCPGIIAKKMIALGEGVLGWVDFWDGVLVCDLLREPMDAYFIPFPQPLPENGEIFKEFHPGNPASRERDVVASNGVIKFIEIEHRWIVTTILPEKPSDPSEKGVLYDSDLIKARKRKNMDDKPKQVRKRDGWRAVTWTRTISSNCWHKGCIVDVDDISVDDTMFSTMMSELGVEHDEFLKFRNLYSSWRTLSIDGDDTLYLKTVVKPNDQKGLVVAVDLGEKALKTFCAYNFDRHDPVQYAYRPFSLSRYLDMTSEDSCQITQEKDSTDPLEVRKSEAEEAQDALEAQTEPEEAHDAHEAQTELQDVSRGSNTENNQDLCDQNGVLPTSTSCLPHPPQPNTNQPHNHPNTHDVIPHHAPKSLGTCLQQPPQANINRWNGVVGNHLYTHGANQNQWNGAGYYPHAPNIVQNQGWSNSQGYSTYPGQLPGRDTVHQPGILRAPPFPWHANLHQPAILPAGPFPRHTVLHRPGPGILPIPAAHRRSKASEQWLPGSGSSAPAWTYSKRRRGS